MKKPIVLIVFMLVSFFSKNILAEAQSKVVIWGLDKISNADVFGEKDVSVINNLKSIYSKVTIVVGEKKVDVKNDFLEKNNVCSVDYVEVKKTPLEYFLSQKTVDMYEHLLSREDIVFSKSLSIIESTFPDQSCPSPYDEVIKNDDHLMVLDQNYVVFFKEIKPALKLVGEVADKENLSKYCHNQDVNKAYDGNSKYICDFTGVNLKEAYEKIRTLNGLSSKYMNEELPSKNHEYKRNGHFVSYKWTGDKMLKISVSTDGEETKYSFSEKASGTRLEILSATQY